MPDQTTSPDSTTVAVIAGWRDLLEIGSVQERNQRCRSYLEALRWPDGVFCPRCGSRRTSRVRARNQIDCRACHYRFSVTSGTHLHDSGVAVWKWLVAVSLLVESEDGFPAHRLAGAVGVSYKTAWSLGHRIRAAMGQASGGEPTSNGVESGATGRVDPAIAGRYHRVSLRYLPAYVAERDWRARNQSNPDAFRDAVLALLQPARVPVLGPA